LGWASVSWYRERSQRWVKRPHRDLASLNPDEDRTADSMRGRRDGAVRTLLSKHFNTESKCIGINGESNRTSREAQLIAFRASPCLFHLLSVLDSYLPVGPGRSENLTA
jgi:hypothetical protein